MQSFLSFLFEATFLTGTAYVSTGFVLGVIRLWHASHPAVVTMKTKQRQQAALPAATAPVMVEAIAFENVRELEPIILEDEIR